MNPQILSLAGLIIAAKGAGIGVMIAFLGDIVTWSQSGQPFDWKVATRKYIGGFAKGLLIGIGIAAS